MSDYEKWNLIITTLSAVSTFGLFVIAILLPKKANLAIYFQPKPNDTKQWSHSMASMDFIIENRGQELKNIRISSNPDFLGWGKLKDKQITPKATSEYFSKIPYLAQGERYSFFWCDLHANSEILEKPFEIIVEHDNPIFPFLKRQSKTIKYDFSVFDNIIWGINEKYDIHNVTQELMRIREYLEKSENKK